MEKIYILAGPNNYIDNLIKDLKGISVDTELTYSLFELKKKAENSKPSAILIADNLKEKQTDVLLPALLENEYTTDIPLLGLTTAENYMDSTLAFFNNGAFQKRRKKNRGNETVIFIFMITGVLRWVKLPSKTV
ncbi:MAG: hypothetical protein P8X42_16555 [Calditrichaceae bacterium]